VAAAGDQPGAAGTQADVGGADPQRRAAHFVREAHAHAAAGDAGVDDQAQGLVRKAQRGRRGRRSGRGRAPGGAPGLGRIGGKGRRRGSDEGRGGKRRTGAQELAPSAHQARRGGWRLLDGHRNPPVYAPNLRRILSSSLEQPRRLFAPDRQSIRLRSGKNELSQ